MVFERCSEAVFVIFCGIVGMCVSGKYFRCVGCGFLARLTAFSCRFVCYLRHARKVF